MTLALSGPADGRDNPAAEDASHQTVAVAGQPSDLAERAVKLPHDARIFPSAPGRGPATEVELRRVDILDVERVLVVNPRHMLRPNAVVGEQGGERRVVKEIVLPALLPLDHELDQVPA